MAKKKKSHNRPAHRLRSIAIRIAAFVIIVPILIILLFRWAPLPTSAFMLRQRLSGTVVDYHWVPMERISPHAATLAAVLPNPKKMSAGRPSDYVIQRTEEILEQMNLLGGTDFIRQGIKTFHGQRR